MNRDIAELDQFNHFEVINSLLPKERGNLLDIGCGTGWLKNNLPAHWNYLGVECSPVIVPNLVDSHFYFEGTAEKLPSFDQKMDVICFVNSFHHIDPENYQQAYQNALEIMDSRGLLILIEPNIYGPYYELTRFIDDETDLRRGTQVFWNQQKDLREIKNFEYRELKTFNNFEEFKSRNLQFAPERKSIFASSSTPEQLFESGAFRDGELYCFYQPLIVRVFEPLS